MSESSRQLEQAIALSRLDPLHYQGTDDGFILPNPYGGRLLGQAISAAGQTVEHARSLHSMHAYFMRTGKRLDAINYQVQALRDGGSFSSRRVEASQHEKQLFSCICGYHTFEPNIEGQLAQMPQVPCPSTLQADQPWSEVVVYQSGAVDNPGHPIHAFDLRFVLDDQQQSKQARPDKRQLWVKYKGNPQNQRSHEALFGWFSDFFLLPTVLKPLGVNLGSDKLRIASLDHALWIHQPLNIQQWLLFDYRCTVFGHSRAHTEAKVYNQQGTLIASMVQEGLLQLR